MALRDEASPRRVELEGPEEVVAFLEGGSDSPEFVDEVLHARNALGAELAVDDGVVGESNAALIDLSVATLVDEAADGVAAGVAVGDVWLDNADHVDGGLVELDEDSVVELSQTEELHDLLALGVQLVDTVKVKRDKQLTL